MSILANLSVNEINLTSVLKTRVLKGFQLKIDNPFLIKILEVRLHLCEATTKTPFTRILLTFSF